MSNSNTAKWEVYKTVDLKKRFVVVQGKAMESDGFPRIMQEVTTFEIVVFKDGIAQVNHPLAIGELLFHGHDLVYDDKGEKQLTRRAKDIPIDIVKDGKVVDGLNVGGETNVQSSTGRVVELDGGVL